MNNFWVNEVLMDSHNLPKHIHYSIRLFIDTQAILFRPGASDATPRNKENSTYLKPRHTTDKYEIVKT